MLRAAVAVLLLVAVALPAIAMPSSTASQHTFQLEAELGIVRDPIGCPTSGAAEREGAGPLKGGPGGLPFAPNSLHLEKSGCGASFPVAPANVKSLRIRGDPNTWVADAGYWYSCGIVSFTGSFSGNASFCIHTHQFYDVKVTGQANPGETMLHVTSSVNGASIWIDHLTIERHKPLGL